MTFAPPMIAAGILVMLAGASLAVWGLPAGDRTRGERVYSRCFACHAIDRDRTGPRHAGLFGRQAGSLPGFAYSPAMRKAGVNGLIWSEETLDRFLQNPTKFIPGNRMGYAGIADAQERADLLAYLKAATNP